MFFWAPSQKCQRNFSKADVNPKNCLQEEKRLSEEFSSLVNKAYFTLLNPLKRGLYMLEQHGVYVEEGTIQSSPAFLMEIMERNEDVDNAKSAEQLETLNLHNKATSEKLIR